MNSLTLPISRNLVNITIIVELCSHNIRQKSSVVSASGPWVATYALRYLYPCNRRSNSKNKAFKSQVTQFELLHDQTNKMACASSED